MPMVKEIVVFIIAAARPARPLLEGGELPSIEPVAEDSTQAGMVVAVEEAMISDAVAKTKFALPKVKFVEVVVVVVLVVVVVVAVVRTVTCDGFGDCNGEVDLDQEENRHKCENGFHCCRKLFPNYQIRGFLGDKEQHYGL